MTLLHSLDVNPTHRFSIAPPIPRPLAAQSRQNQTIIDFYRDKAGLRSDARVDCDLGRDSAESERILPKWHGDIPSIESGMPPLVS